MKRFLFVLLSILIFSAALPVPFAAAESNDELTLMVYITGSDLESESGAATADITEMLRSGVDVSKVNILLMTGGSYKWWGGFPSDQLCIYQIEGRRPKLLQRSPLVSMGEADTLSYFLDYGYQNFPAQQFALVLWDHGGGPMNGLCFDEIFAEAGSRDSLSLMELRSALTASPFSEDNPLEWIGFDACLMSAVETAYICAPFARYMIASQEVEPGTGWNYAFLSEIDNFDTGAETGRAIIDNYFSGKNTDSALTLSCIDLSRIFNVETAMNNFFEQLDQIINPESFSQLSNSRRETHNIGRASTGSEYDLVDLRHLAMQYEQYTPEAARQLQDAVDAAVVYQKSNIENTYGLSAYYPFYNKEYYSQLWMKMYSEFDFANQYLHYMSDYARLWLGDPLTDWDNLRAAAIPSLEDNTQTLSMSLTEEQLTHFASAELYVLDEIPSGGGYYDIYHIDDIQPQGRTLTTQYDYSALYVVDENNNPLSDALIYTIQDGVYFVRAVLCDESAEADYTGWLESAMEHVYLQCLLDEQTNELDIIGVLSLPDTAPFSYPGKETVLLSGKQTLTTDSDDWPFIYFVRHPRVMATDENGFVCPYPDWPYPDEVVEAYVLFEYHEVDNKQPWKLKFCSQQYTGRNLNAQYVVTDTQGTYFASDLLPIENPTLKHSYDSELTVADNEDYSIRLTSFDVVDSAIDPGVYIYGVYEGRSDKQFRLSAENFIFERLALSYEDTTVASDFAAEAIGMRQPFHFFIPADALTGIDDLQMDLLSFDLRIVDSNFNSVIIPVVYEKTVDLSSICDLSDPIEPMALSTIGDADCELLSLTEFDEGLNARLHIVNNGNSTLHLDWLCCDSQINHHLFLNGFAGTGINLPAGCHQYIDAVFYRTTPAQMLDESCLPEVDGFNFWEIDSVENLSIDNTVEFTLPEPVDVSHGHVILPDYTLVANDEISVNMCSIAFDDDLLKAEFQLSNLTDAEIDICVDSIRLNNADVNFLTMVEDFTSLDGWTLPASCSMRAGLSIGLQETIPETLLFFFHYNGNDRNDVRVEAIFDCVNYAVEVPENNPIDPMCLLNPSVSLPEDAVQYRVILNAQLSEEQAATFDKASVVLAKYIPDKNAYRLSYLKHDAVLDDDGLLSIDYNGLLVCAEGESHPFIANEQATGENIEIFNAVLDDANLRTQNLHFNSIGIRLSDNCSAAVIESTHASRAVHELEKFTSLELMYQTQFPVRQENGVLAHILDWPHDSFIASQSYEIQKNLARFSMIPAKDVEDMYVIFCIYNKDGSGYCLEPIPYAEACITQ